MADKNVEMGKKLRELRGNRPLREIASKVPCSQSSLLRWEEGRVPNAEVLEKLATIYKADPSSILAHGETREGSSPYGFSIPPGLRDDLPIVGRARGGRGEFSHDGYPTGQGWRRVRRPYDVRDKNAFAVEVVGDSMAPRYEAGDVVVCSPEKEWRSGDYCVVVMRDDEALVKKVTVNDGVLVLSSIAPGVEPQVISRQEVRSITKIVWKKER